MEPNSKVIKAGAGLSFFEKYLTLWVFICILLGIFLGKLFPAIAQQLDALSIYNVSIPIAICLFFMMYPIMVKIDFSQAVKAAKAPKPVLLTLVVNWLIKPFTMVVFAQFFLGWLFLPFYIRSGAFTMPEFLEKRFDARSRWFLSLFSLVAYVLTKVSVTIYAGGIVVSELL